MKSRIFALTMLLAALGLPLLSGCDDDVVEELEEAWEEITDELDDFFDDLNVRIFVFDH